MKPFESKGKFIIPNDIFESYDAESMKAHVLKAITSAVLGVKVKDLVITKDRKCTFTITIPPWYSEVVLNARAQMGPKGPV